MAEAECCRHELGADGGGEGGRVGGGGEEGGEGAQDHRQVFSVHDVLHLSHHNRTCHLIKCTLGQVQVQNGYCMGTLYVQFKYSMDITNTVQVQYC